MKYRILAAIAVAVGSCALGGSTAGAGARVNAEAGVLAAKAHHVPITAAAAKDMEMFPAGTCSNNPFLKRCGQQPQYIYAESNVRDPSRSLRAFLATHGGLTGSYSGCKVRVTELHSTGIKEKAAGNSHCWAPCPGSARTWCCRRRHSRAIGLPRRHRILTV